MEEKRQSIESRKAYLILGLETRMTTQRVTQSELARRMVDLGWSTYSQMTVSRTLSGARTVGAVEYEDLLEALGVKWAPGKDDAVELAVLRVLADLDVLREASGGERWQPGPRVEA